MNIFYVGLSNRSKGDFYLDLATNNEKLKIPHCGKSNRKIVGEDQIDIPQMHDLSISWLGTGTSIKVAGLN